MYNMIAVQGMGGGGEEPFLMLSNVLDTKGVVGGGNYPPVPRWGLFVEININSIAPMYMIEYTRGGAVSFVINISNVLDTKEEGVRRYPPPTVGDFLEIWVLNRGFWCIINFKLTLILAENVYDCSTGGGGKTFLCLLSGVLHDTTEGEGVEGVSPPTVGTFWQFWY